MKTTAASIEDKIESLLVCLDRDAQYMQDSLEHLNQMRGFIIKRDEAGLSKLFESIQAGSGCYRENELNRKAIRTELAESFGCETDKMTLSALESSLPETNKEKIAQIKTKLRSLSLELRKEYLNTALLLSECSRFNSLLLRCIFNFSKSESIHYKSNGRTKRQIETSFVNIGI